MTHSDAARRFDGRVVLVTGGAHGIGAATARRLAGEGATVVVADLDTAAAATVVADLGDGDGAHHRAIALDVTSRRSVDEACAAIAGERGRLDAVVHTVGGDTHHGTFEATDDEVWSRMFDLNTLGAVRVCRAAIPLLRATTAETAAIVLVSSVNATQTLGSEPYSSAKAALGPLIANLAAGLAGDRTRVDAVVPATIRTRVWDDQPGGAEQMVGLYPLGRVGEPGDVAAAVAFLASADASWITGHQLPVDGGFGIAAASLPT